MIVSRTEILVGFGVVALAGAGFWAWSRGRPRFEVLREGDTQAVAVREHRRGGNAPKGFEMFANSGEGTAPTRLFIRLPAAARGRFAASRSMQSMPLRNMIVAQAFLPNGEAIPLSVERMDSGRDEAMVAIPHDLPSGLPYLDVEVASKGIRSTRWRLLNLPVGAKVYDPSVVRTDQGEGARRIHGQAWRILAKTPYDPERGPGVLVGIAAPGFHPGAGEATTIRYRLSKGFTEPGAALYDSGGQTQAYDGSRAISFSEGMAYAGYVQTARVRGSLLRRRVFDEWIDFGEVPLRPRAKGFGGTPSLYDAEPDLKEPRFATTPSGLRLRLEPTTIADNSGYGGDRQSVAFLIHADEATRRRGLPKDFPTAKPTVEVDREGGQDALFSSLDPEPESGPQNSRWTFFRDGKPKSLRMRMRVRRSVVIEETPFDLRLPLQPLPKGVRATSSPNGTSYYEADPATLLPKS